MEREDIVATANKNKETNQRRMTALQETKEVEPMR
jgi:hypothetical protein